MYKIIQNRVLQFFVFLFFAGSSHATTHIIEAMDSSFTPDSLNILVGDTVIWTWINGSHTITSNGIPDGASPWNELLDSFHPTFTYVVTIPGTYNYISVPDIPDMQGQFIASYPIGISSPLYSAMNFILTPNLVEDKFCIQFQIPVTGEVGFYISDISGKKKDLLLNATMASGTYNEEFYLSNEYTPGLYLVTMKYLNTYQAIKMIIK